MTILDKDYATEFFQPEDAPRLEFSQEYLEEKDIRVAFIYGPTHIQTLLPQQYDLEPGGRLDRKFQGGTVVLKIAVPSTVDRIGVFRRTDIDQLVNYRPFGPFPADTTEFTIDKLTMIAQEIEDQVQYLLLTQGIRGGIEEAPLDGSPYARQDGTWVNTQGADGIYVKLEGTTEAQPITGPLHFQGPLGEFWKVDAVPFLGVNSLQWTTSGEDSSYTIQTKNQNGTLNSFGFTSIGQILLPSSLGDDSRYWQIVGNDFFGFPNALGFQSFTFDLIDGVVVEENPIVFSTADERAFIMRTDGKLQTWVNTESGDPDTFFATKGYVDANIGGPGGLPPGQDDALLWYDGSEWVNSPGLRWTQEWLGAGSDDALGLTGAILIEDASNPGELWYINTEPYLGSNALILNGNSSGADTFIVAPNGLNAPAFIVAGSAVNLNNGMDLTVSGDCNISGGLGVTGQVNILSLDVAFNVRANSYLQDGPQVIDPNVLTKKSYVDGQLNAKANVNNTVTLNTSQEISAFKRFLGDVAVNGDLAGAGQWSTFGTITGASLTAYLGGISSAGQVNIGAAAPTQPDDATRKDYVDSQLLAVAQILGASPQQVADIQALF